MVYSVLRRHLLLGAKNYTNGTRMSFGGNKFNIYTQAGVESRSDIDLKYPNTGLNTIIYEM
jgi:hypothetical protein